MQYYSGLPKISAKCSNQAFIGTLLWIKLGRDIYLVLCVHVYTGVLRYSDVCVEARSQSWISSIVPQKLFTVLVVYLFKAGFLSGLEITNQATWAASQPQGSCFSSVLWLQALASMPSTFMWVLETELRLLGLHGKAFVNWTIPLPRQSIFYSQKTF